MAGNIAYAVINYPGLQKAVAPVPPSHPVMVYWVAVELADSNTMVGTSNFSGVAGFDYGATQADIEASVTAAVRAARNEPGLTVVFLT